MTECYRSQKHGQLYRKLAGKLHGHNVITQVDVYGRPIYIVALDSGVSF